MAYLSFTRRRLISFLNFSQAVCERGAGVCCLSGTGESVEVALGMLLTVMISVDRCKVYVATAIVWEHRRRRRLTWLLVEAYW
jgi:hypothetical protein